MNAGQTVTIKGTEYVVEMFTSNDEFPLVKASMEQRGWIGAAMVRKVNGKRQYLAYVDTKGTASLVHGV